MNYLKQSTAVDIDMGPFVDSTDGVTPETALSLTQAETRLKKNAGAWAAKNEATTATHEEEGNYEVKLDATDTDTLGILAVKIYVAGALPVWRYFQVIPGPVYDSLFAGSDKLQVDTVEVSGTAQTAGDIVADTNDIQNRLPAALTGGKMESNVGTVTAGAIVAASFAANALDAVWSTASRTLTGFGTLVADIWASGTRTLTAFAFTVTATDVAAIKAKTDLLPADPASDTTVLTRSSHSAADVWAVGTRTLTGFGTLVADIWTHATRTLTAFAFTVTGAKDAVIDAIDAKTTNLPSDPADQSIIAGILAGLATTAHLTTVEAKVDAVGTIVANIYGVVDLEIAAIKLITDRLSGMIQLDGAGPGYQFTVAALEQAPAGGGGGGGGLEGDDVVEGSVTVIQTLRVMLALGIGQIVRVAANTYALQNNGGTKTLATAVIGSDDSVTITVGDLT